MCVSWRYLFKCLLFYWLRNVWVSGWLQAFRTSTVDSFCGVRACAGVYVPCVATPPFPIFIELCLSLKPWQQKMTNGRTVEMLRLCARLNGRVSFLDLNIFFCVNCISEHHGWSFLTLQSYCLTRAAQ